VDLSASDDSNDDVAAVSSTVDVSGACCSHALPSAANGAASESGGSDSGDSICAADGSSSQTQETDESMDTAVVSNAQSELSEAIGSGVLPVPEQPTSVKVKSCTSHTAHWLALISDSGGGRE